MKSKILFIYMIMTSLCAVSAYADCTPKVLHYEDFEYNVTQSLHDRFTDISTVRTPDEIKGFSSGWQLKNGNDISSDKSWIIKSENPYTNDEGKVVGFAPYYLRALKNSSSAIYRDVVKEKRILPNPLSDNENIYYISWEQYIGEGVDLNDSSRIEFNSGGVTAGIKQKDGELYPYVKWVNEWYGSDALERGKTYKFVFRLEANKTADDIVSLKVFEKSVGYKPVNDIEFTISAGTEFAKFGIASATVNMDTPDDEDVRFAAYKAELFKGSDAFAAVKKAEAAMEALRKEAVWKNYTDAENAVSVLGDGILRQMLQKELLSYDKDGMVASPVVINYEDFEYNTAVALHNRFANIGGVSLPDEAKGFSGGWRKKDGTALDKSEDSWFIKSENPYINEKGEETGFAPYYLQASKNSSISMYRDFAGDRRVRMKPETDGDNIYYISWEQYVGENVDLKGVSGIEFITSGVSAGLEQKADGSLLPYVKWVDTIYGDTAVERGKTYKFVLRIAADKNNEDRVSLKVFEKSSLFKSDYDVDFEINAGTEFSVLGIVSSTVNKDVTGDEDVRFAAYKTEHFSGKAYNALVAAENAVDELKRNITAENIQNAEKKLSGLENCTASDMLLYEIEAIVKGQFDTILARRKASIVPVSSGYSSTISAKVKSYVSSAKSLMGSMLYDSDVLWSGNNYVFGETKGTDLFNAYSNINTMAKAYSAAGSELEGNSGLLESIIYALGFLGDKYYNKEIDLSKKGNANWWYYEIGIPQNIAEILIILGDELPAQLRNDMLETIYYHVAEPDMGTFSSKKDMVGTNLVWKCGVLADIGIATENADYIRHALEKSSAVLIYSDDTDVKDGFYRDGTFLQHDNVSYNGGYGIDAFNNMINLISVFSGTEFSFDNEDRRFLYDIAYNSYASLIFDGAMLDMVRGRYICRYSLSSFSTGLSALSGMYILSLDAPEYDKQKLENIIRSNLKTDESKRRFVNAVPINYTESAESFINKTVETAKNDAETAKVFGHMDRAVYRTGDYLFGISMASDRIKKFESVNGENLKGWYTGYGATYIQTGDYMHYSRNYWNTVNPYMLAGITVTDRVLKRGEFAYVPYDDEAYAGGAVLGDRYAAVGMKLKDFEDSNGKLSVKKAWFMMDNQIAALGNGIGGSNRNVYTVVDNRVISENAEVYLGDVANSFGESFEKSDARFAYIGGTSNIGYWFPENQNITVKSEKRSGAWSDIRNDADTTIQTNNYASLVIDHGKNPENASYEYVILPGRTKAETKQYSESPKMTVLENSVNAASVKSEISGTVGVCFWENAPYKSGIVKSDKALVVVYGENNGLLEISISDPEHKGGVATVELDTDALEVYRADENISVSFAEGKAILTVSLDNLNGSSAQVALKLPDVRFDKKGDILNVTCEGDGVYIGACYRGEKMISCNIIEESAQIPLEGSDKVKVIQLESLESLIPKNEAHVFYNK